MGKRLCFNASSVCWMWQQPHYLRVNLTHKQGPRVLLQEGRSWMRRPCSSLERKWWSSESLREYMAHINLLIVGAHSKYNDSLFVDDSVMDWQARPPPEPVCSEALVGQQGDRKENKKTGYNEPWIPYPGHCFKQEDMEGLDSDSTVCERKWKEEEVGMKLWDLGHISVWLSLRGCQ